MKHIRSTPFRRLLSITLTVATASIMIGGCMGYRLGSMLPPGIESVHVPPFTNKTDELGIEVATTQATISELQKEGTLRTVAREDSDAIIEVTLNEFKVNSIIFDRERPRAAQEYKMTLTATVRFINARSDELHRQFEVSGYATFESTGDMRSDKLTQTPRLSADLARQIVKRIIEFW